MEVKQRPSLFARAQRFFLSSMGCAGSSVGAQQEVSLVLPLTYERCDAPSANRKKFHEEYSLKAKLGKGAFAQVHLAHRNSDGEEVAVKIADLRGPKAGKGEADPRVRRAVEREVMILRRVGSQEYCVGFHEDYAEGLLSYVVMERCDMTLLQAMERLPELTENTLSKLVSDMLQGMQNIHQLGVVHRDVKPDNFLCTGEDFTVKLCDFGLAEVLGSLNGELKGVYGTAPFMSPEMLAGSGYGMATDVWSLGVIAYVLLLGHFPYQPIETTAKAMKAAILSGVPQPSFKLRPSLDVLGGSATSPTALEFLKATLNRNKTARPSAAAALQLPWLSDKARSQQWSLPSLRPMLYAAKREGAFDTRGVGSKHDKGTTVDALLQELQVQPGGGGGGGGAGGVQLPALAKKTRSEGGHDAKDDKKLDPLRGQSGCMVASNASHVSTATGSSSGTTGTSCQSHRSRTAGPRSPTMRA